MCKHAHNGQYSEGTQFTVRLHTASGTLYPGPFEELLINNSIHQKEHFDQQLDNFKLFQHKISSKVILVVKTNAFLSQNNVHTKCTLEY